MAKINTTINIHVDGVLYPLNKQIKQVSPVSKQQSAIDMIAKPIGGGFKTGDILKKIRRAQISSTAATKIGGTGGFVGASSQELHSVPTNKYSREDNIIYNESDLEKLKEGKGGSLMAMEVADFMIYGKEIDLKEMLAEGKVAALAVKLHTAFDATTGLPTGAQPADGDGSFAQAITAIEGGRRVIEVTDFDEELDTRISLIREYVSYFTTIGTPKNPTESEYLYSINGTALNQLSVLCTYKANIKIKDKDTTRFVSVNNNTKANMTGIVSHIDNEVRILQTSQMSKETEYIISTDRVFTRDLDQTQQYIGKVRDAAAVVMRDGTTKNLKPNERLLQFLQARIWCVRYDSEIGYIDQK